MSFREYAAVAALQAVLGSHREAGAAPDALAAEALRYADALLDALHRTDPVFGPGVGHIPERPDL
jgi:hypothetical protein